MRQSENNLGKIRKAANPFSLMALRIFDEEEGGDLNFRRAATVNQLPTVDRLEILILVDNLTDMLSARSVV